MHLKGKKKFSGELQAQMIMLWKRIFGKLQAPDESFFIIMDHAKYNQSLPIIPVLLACHINVMYYKIFWRGVYIITIPLYTYIFLSDIYIYLEGCPHYHDHHIVCLGGHIIKIIYISRWVYDYDYLYL